jgi:16S rRNA C1402 (ribose-2'-O) methylase RsmI
MNDLTPNIIKALFSVDLIGCEDRRIAGLLYQLIRNKNIIDDMTEKFGTLGLSNVVEKDFDPNSPEY